jgi:hypothetical protein
MNNKNESNVLNEITNDESFEKKIELKLLERFNRYYHDIKKMKKLIKHGFNSEDDFKKFNELYFQIENRKDYINVKVCMNYYRELKNFTTYSFK